METEDLFDENEFLVSGPLWLILDNCGRARSPEEVCGLAIRMSSEASPETGRIVVFTDRDLAKRFIEADGRIDKLKPVSFPTPETFAKVLRRMIDLGETELAFDPGENNVRFLSIDRVLRGIDRRGT